ncbi:MAG: GNAT family N-acetyltransferase [Bdellovibrionota bacterium]|nr:GNAT family N-acetyltransferase [Bdellovibrionota bacterium]
MLEIGDEEFFQEIFKNPSLMKFSGGALSEEAVKLRFRSILKHGQSEIKEKLYWLIDDSEENQKLGFIGFNCHNILDTNTREIGIVLSEEAIASKSKSYALNSFCATIDFGFNVLGLNKIFCRILRENIAAQKLVLKCGMSFKEIPKGYLELPGGKANDFLYADILAKKL